MHFVWSYYMASTEISVRSIPEQGQIVTIRRRKYVVTDIQEAHLSQNLLQNSLKKSHYLVELASIEDDGLGETLAMTLITV